MVARHDKSTPLLLNKKKKNVKKRLEGKIGRTRTDNGRTKYFANMQKK